MTFGQVAAPHVRLVGSIFATPIEGREKVWTSLRAAGGITDTLSFTYESTAPDRSYLEWELQALAQRAEGSAVLTLDGSGLIDMRALHHRPLGAVLAFQAEMGRRLGNLSARACSTKPLRAVYCHPLYDLVGASRSTDERRARSPAQASVVHGGRDAKALAVPKTAANRRLPFVQGVAAPGAR
jgi:hypothetical protein